MRIQRKVVPAVSATARTVFVPAQKVSTAKTARQVSQPPRFYLKLAFVVSLLASLGSLYFSEVDRYLPCELCWYQRICMYPLALVLGLGLLTGDRRVDRYALPLAGIGFFIAFYHNVIYYLAKYLP